MDKAEAKRLLDECLAEYRGMPYAELAALIGQVRTHEMRGALGVEYQIEVTAHWDHRPGGDVRLLGSIDDGGLWSAFRPLCGDFIVAPDGKFVGE